MTAGTMPRIDSSETIAVFEVASPEAMARFGARLAMRLRQGDAIALEGGLGSGKTTLARGLIRALAGIGVTVPSPTFTLVQTYPTAAFDIWHCDLYRLAGPEETGELGLDEVFIEGVALIEWPDRLGHLLPAHRLRIEISFGAQEDSRVLRLEGPRDWHTRLAGIADDVA